MLQLGYSIPPLGKKRKTKLKSVLLPNLEDKLLCLTSKANEDNPNCSFHKQFFHDPKTGPRCSVLKQIFCCSLFIGLKKSRIQNLNSPLLPHCLSNQTDHKREQIKHMSQSPKFRAKLHYMDTHIQIHIHIHIHIRSRSIKS